MRLERVNIAGFGPLSRFELVFEPKRLNLLIGPNESGKSTFASAVVATLFGFTTPQGEALARPWAGGPHAAEIVFQAGSGRYRLRRNFETHEVQVDQLAVGSEESQAVLFPGTANPRGRNAELAQYAEILRGL